MDDYIVGAITTVAGVSNGKFNVKQDIIRYMIMQPEISVDKVPNGFYTSKRQKQRIVQTVKHALSGISLYIDRHREEVDSYVQGHRPVDDIDLDYYYFSDL